MKKTAWRIRYKDNDPGSPVFSTVVRGEGYHREDAVLHFWDLGPDDDWRIVSVEKIKTEAN